jgi:hypothetical protein
LVVVVAVSRYSATAQSWFGVMPSNAPTVGGFLYVTLASVAAGMVVSALRWLLLDPLHHVTGIREPQWDFTALPDRLSAFLTMVENHYRYYQFYGNMLVALIIFAVVHQTEWPSPFETQGASTLAMFALVGLFYLSSRDTLQKYYARVAMLLENVPKHERSEIMTNGCGTEEHFAEKRKPANLPPRQKKERSKTASKEKLKSSQSKNNGR